MPLDSISPDHKPVAPEDATGASAQKTWKADEKLAKTLIRWKEDIELLDRDKRLKLFRQQIKAHQYFDGNFYGYVNGRGEWIDTPTQDYERSYQDNQYYSYVRTAQMELSRRNTQLQVNPASDTEQGRAAAKFLTERINANRDRTFTAHLKQTESLYALLNGIVFRYTYFEFNKSNNRRERIPKVHRKEKPDEKLLCANCSNRVTDDEPCSNCGSTITKHIKGSDFEVVIGYEDLRSGANCWVSPNPVSVIVSMQASKIEESPFIKWKQLHLRSVLEERYSRRDLPSTGTSTELKYIGNQQTATPANDTSGYEESTVTDEGKEFELLELQQTWLDYAIYANKTFTEDQTFSNGKVLQAGRKMGEMFPDGLYFASVGDLIVDTWNEDKNLKWTSSPYSLRAGSMYGAGTTPAHAQQELINDFKTLEMANAWNNAIPKEFVDPTYIEELSLDPQVPTNLISPIGESGNIIGRAYAQAPPSPLGQEVYVLEENAKGSMQNQIGALSNSGAGGLSDSEQWGSTATAISIRRELAVGRFTPDLELFADNLDKRQAIQFIKNEQKNFTPKQWRSVAGDSGAEAIEFVRQADIDQDFIVTVVQGSYIPKSESQTISRTMGFIDAVTRAVQLGNPEIINYLGEVFGIPPEIVGFTPDRIGARELLERFKGLAERYVEAYEDLPTSDLRIPQVAEVANAINSYSQMPVDVWLDNHDAVIEALRDWRNTDEGRTASNAMLAAVAMRVNQHSDAKVVQAQMDAKRQMEAAAPMKEMQEEEEAKQLALNAVQTEEANQAAQSQQEMQIAEGVGQMAESQAQRDHEAEQAEADRMRDVAVAQIQSNQQ